MTCASRIRRFTSFDGPVTPAPDEPAAPDEEHPPIAGDLKLVDAESERSRELTITPSLLGEYRRALAAHRAGLTRAAQAAGGRFLRSGSDDDLEATALSGLRAGVLRRG